MADGDCDGLVSAVELMAVVQCIRHLAHDLAVGGGADTELVRAQMM